MRRLESGTGQSNGGVWVTAEGHVMKRLVPGVTDVRHHAYWERQALVAESGIVAQTPGLRSPRYLDVRRGADGITMVSEYVEPVPVDAARLAEALGRFARAGVEEPAWGARDVLRDRMATVEARGGWKVLWGHVSASLRETLQELWVRRAAVLAALDELPRVPTHGDAHPGNLLGWDGENVVALDWEQFGLGPAGFDLGYLVVALPDQAESLLAVDSVVRRGAVLTAVLTAASRAAWALGQPERGDHLERLEALADYIEEASSQAL
ncbi:aminoglycoside phosphotransferase family protein [Kribbella sp. NPDC005582]|uniref:aminoglycoside phosphotransferase family protein n=1 Tax=Kribbella sp. NPDC005582 TaxID=3156893 RepID=UPI0033B7B598